MATNLRKRKNKLFLETLLKAFPDRRRHLRFGFEKEIHYALNSEQCFEGIINDISYSGISLFVSTPLFEGQEITLMSDDKTLNRRATVCWSREVGDNIYKVGLEFLVR